MELRTQKRKLRHVNCLDTLFISSLTFAITEMEFMHGEEVHYFLSYENLAPILINYDFIGEIIR